MSSLILAGDIGATKTALALYDTGNISDISNTGADMCSNVQSNAQSGLLAEKTFRNKEFSSLTDVITSFLAGQKERPARACFGAAGPIRANKVRMTNLDWDLDGSALAAQFGMDEVLLVNDLVGDHCRGGSSSSRQLGYPESRGDPRQGGVSAS